MLTPVKGEGKGKSGDGFQPTGEGAENLPRPSLALAFDKAHGSFFPPLLIAPFSTKKTTRDAQGRIIPAFLFDRIILIRPGRLGPSLNPKEPPCNNPFSP
jgi:hypothetical protein